MNNNIPYVKHTKCGWTGYADEVDENDLKCPRCDRVVDYSEVEWKEVCPDCGGSGEIALDQTKVDFKPCFNCNNK